MSSCAAENDLISGAEKPLAALKRQQPLTRETRTVLLRQIDKLRCGLQGPVDAMHFQGTVLDGTIGLEDLASKMGWEPAVLVRFINVVLIHGIFEEPEPRVYKHSASSTAFREDAIRAYYRLGSWSVPSWWKVSDYLKTHAPEDVYDPLKSPFSYSRGGEGQTYYQLLEADPAFSTVWHKGMAQAALLNPVLGMFPFRDMRSAVEAEPGRAFVVDVGGGRGNALVDVMRECGGGGFGAPMVLQDLEEVLLGEEPVRIDGVQVMPHDFYNEQPIKK
ncbi:O-methyltransferase-like protein [Apiospora aurea]|uniref:O-methyltransferase-like protein n=1 Tax=Apiospora aurea TaxID=335848 RepID=A0ABR1QPV7_9PEZI